jgi:hypothetical protein
LIGTKFALVYTELPRITTLSTESDTPLPLSTTNRTPNREFVSVSRSHMLHDHYTWNMCLSTVWYTHRLWGGRGDGGDVVVVIGVEVVGHTMTPRTASPTHVVGRLLEKYWSHVGCPRIGQMIPEQIKNTYSMNGSRYLVSWYPHTTCSLST